MFPNAKALVLFVSCALLARAQDSSASTTTTSAPAAESSSAANLTPCLLTCVTQAATSGGCASYADISCVCTSATFQSAATACLQASCTADDLAAAQALQQQQCGALTTGASTATGASTTASTGTASGTTLPVSSVSSSSTKASSSSTSAKTSTSASASQAATSSSAAMPLSAPFSLGSFVGTLVASAGALVGAAFVL
ncbi:hypothetical protein HD554DRAFT_2178323 [Boletus coccyginus]|nr:hypothetical protein HD554DRAFT_2178323 [Boletus coccyginus]